MDTTTPIAGCPACRSPLVLTFNTPGKEWECVPCGRTLEWLEAVELSNTPGNIALLEQHAATVRDRLLAANPFPVPLEELNLDRGIERNTWARTMIAEDRAAGYGWPVIDGYRVTIPMRDDLLAEWLAAYPPDALRDAVPDPVDAQRWSAEVSRIARTNPGRLPPRMVASLQRHAATVASWARAEMIREAGGTGAELGLVEACGWTVGQALFVIHTFGWSSHDAWEVARSPALVAALSTW